MDRPEFHRLAEYELNEAAQYYDLEEPGLGAAFLEEVDRCLQSIQAAPEAGAILRGTVRRRLLRRFPYALLYKIRPSGIRILAVMNLRRRPTYWGGTRVTPCGSPTSAFSRPAAPAAEACVMRAEMTLAV